jgi:release factor glutamine methyltransferase
LKPGGVLMFEIGVGQERQVSGLFGRAGGYDDALSLDDALHQPRVVMAKRKR